MASYESVHDPTSPDTYSTYENTVSQPIILRTAGARTHAFELLFQYPGRLAQFDLDTIQSNADGSFTFTLDPGAAFQLPPPNVFTVQGMAGSPGGLGGICNVPGLSVLCQQTQQAPILQLYYPIASEGMVNFAFPGGNGIVGEMRIAGYGLDNSNIRGTYFARFNGTLQAQGEC